MPERELHCRDAVNNHTTQASTSHLKSLSFSKTFSAAESPAVDGRTEKMRSWERLCSRFLLLGVFTQACLIFPIASQSTGANDSAKTSSPEATSPAGSRSTNPWPLVTVDGVLMEYATTADRDAALEQISSVWESTLEPDVTGISLVLLSENITQFNGSTTDVITYVVKGEATAPVRPFDAKNLFRVLLSQTPIPVKPIPNEDEGLLDHIWMNYTTAAQRDQFLIKIQQLWYAVLENATGTTPTGKELRLNLFNDEAVLSPRWPANHKVSYLVTGGHPNLGDEWRVKYAFRKALLEANTYGLWADDVEVPEYFKPKTTTRVPPTHPTTTSTETVETTKVTTTDSTISLGNILLNSPIVFAKQRVGTPITDSVLLPAALEPNNTALIGVLRMLWLLSIDFAVKDLEIEVVTNTALPELAADNSTTYNTTYRVWGIPSNLDITEVKQKFHKNLSPTMKTPFSFPTVRQSAAAHPVINPNQIFVTNSTSAHEGAQTMLRNLTAIKQNTTGDWNAFVFDDTVDLRIAANVTGYLDLAMDSVKSAWKRVFGKRVWLVQVLPYSNTTLPSASNSSDALYKVDYVVGLLSKMTGVDVDSARTYVRRAMSDPSSFPEEVEMTTVSTTTEATTTKPRNSQDSGKQFTNFVVVDQLPLEFMKGYNETEFTLLLRSVWMEVAGPLATDVQVEVYRNAPRPLGLAGIPPGNSSVLELAYAAVIRSSQTELDVETLKKQVRELLAGRDEWFKFASPVRAAEIKTNEIDSAFTAKERSDWDPTLAVAINDAIKIRHRDDPKWSWTDDFDFVVKLWESVLGVEPKKIRARVDNFTEEVAADGRKYHLIHYSVYAIINSSTYDQQEVLHRFHVKLVQSNFNATNVLPGELTGLHSVSQSGTNTTTSDHSTQKQPAVIILQTNVTNIGPHERSETLETFSQNGLQVAAPEEINALTLIDNVLVNYTAMSEQEDAWLVVNKLWLSFLGRDVANVLIRPVSDTATSEAGVRGLQYMILILTRNNTYSANWINERFHEYLGKQNETRIIPAKRQDILGNLDSKDDVTIIPSGITFSYSTQTELDNLLMVLQNSWRKVIGNPSATVELMVYDDQIANGLSTQSGKQIHRISYIVIINGTKVDQVQLKRQFDALFLGSSKTSEPIIKAAEAVGFPAAPVINVIPDYVWLVYKSSLERDEILSQLQVLWRKAADGFTNKNISFVFDREEADDSSGGRPNSHKVDYHILLETPTKMSSSDIMQAKIRFRNLIPTTGLLVGFDSVEDIIEEEEEAEGEGENNGLSKSEETPKAESRVLDLEGLPSDAIRGNLSVIMSQNVSASSVGQTIRQIWREFLASEKLNLEFVLIPPVDVKAGGLQHWQFAVWDSSKSKSSQIPSAVEQFQAVLATHNLPFLAEDPN